METVISILKMDHQHNETVLDVINNKLQFLNAKSFIIRVIFVGEHNFLDKKKFGSLYKKKIEKINSDYCDAHITGVLLIYKKYFYVITEGSEDTIVRQIYSLLKSEEFHNMIGITKLLAVYHNIKERYIFSWTTICAEPIVNVDSLSNENTPQAHMDIFKHCIEKLKPLYFVTCDESQNNIDDLASLHPSLQELPDNILTEFILNSSFTMDLKKYAKMYLNLPEYSYTFENCWPAPYDFTPYLEKVETQKSYVELLSNIDDFATEAIDTQTIDLTISNHENEDTHQIPEHENLLEISDNLSEKEQVKERAATFSIPHSSTMKAFQSRKSLQETHLIKAIESFEDTLRLNIIGDESVESTSLGTMLSPKENVNSESN